MASEWSHRKNAIAFESSAAIHGFPSKENAAVIYNHLSIGISDSASVQVRSVCPYLWGAFTQRQYRSAQPEGIPVEQDLPRSEVFASAEHEMASGRSVAGCGWFNWLRQPVSSRY
jgi:hypothetical protein